MPRERAWNRSVKSHYAGKQTGARRRNRLSKQPMTMGNPNDGPSQPEVTIQQVTLAMIDHPTVAEVSVVPCVHPERGAEIVAFVVPHGTAPENEENLRAYVDKRLGTTGLLAKVVYLDELPRSATGKVDRRRLEAGEFSA